MNLQFYSYNSTVLNDGTTWRAAIPVEVNAEITVTAQGEYVVMQAGQEPDLVGKKISERRITVRLTYLGASTMGYAHSVLKALLNPLDKTPRTTVFRDTEDSNRQWYLQTTCESIANPNGRNIDVTLATKSPVFQTVATTTETDWDITSSGDTNTFTVALGNLEVYPTYTLTANTARTGARFTKRRYIKMRNYTKNAASNHKIDVVDSTGSARGFDTRVASGAGNPIADDSNKMQLNGAINDSVTTIAYDTVTGSIPEAGMGYLDTEQVSWTGRTGTTSGNLTGVTRGIGGTTAASHADNAVIRLSTILVNCADVRVFYSAGRGNLAEIPSWIAPLNSQYSRIWTSLDIIKDTHGIIETGIDDNDTSVKITDNWTNIGGFLQEDGLLLIGSEVVAYDSFSTATRTFSGLARGINGSSAAAHAAGVAVYAIPNIQVMYGKFDLTSPDYRTTHPEMPVFDMDNSTNSAWTYNYFWSRTYGAGDEWIPNAQSGKYATAFVYTRDEDWNNANPSDPAEVIGVGAAGVGDVAQWKRYFPFGFTSIVWTNVDRYNLPASKAYVRTAINDGAWEVTAIAANTLVNTKQTTASITSTPTAAHAYYAALYISNPLTVAFTRPARVNVETATVNHSTSTTTDTHGVPYISVGAETDITYALDATLTNNTTGESLKISAQIATGYGLVINTALKTVRYALDNTDMFSAITGFGGPRRNTWLRLLQGANELQYDEVGVVDVTCSVSYKGRAL